MGTGWESKGAVELTSRPGLFQTFVNKFQTPLKFEIQTEALPCSKNVQALQEARFEHNEQLSPLTQLEIANAAHIIIFGTNIQFETSLNFKGVQTFWGKSHKFTKTLSWHDLQYYKFRLTHLYSKI
jgi:hypothetical protein